MSALSLARKQRSNAITCHILKTYFGTLTDYDVDLRLIHALRPDNTALLFTVDKINVGFLVPAKKIIFSGGTPDQFVFPFIITNLGKNRIALQEASSGLFLCCMPPEHKYMAVDKVAIHNWETFTCISLDDDATQHHPAQAFLLHQPFTALESDR